VKETYFYTVPENSIRFSGLWIDKGKQASKQCGVVKKLFQTGSSYVGIDSVPYSLVILSKNRCIVQSCSSMKTFYEYRRIMLFKRVIVICTFVFAFSCLLGCPNNLPISDEDLVEDVVQFSRLLSQENTELVLALHKYVTDIVGDFKERGCLYNAWKNNNDSKFVRFSFGGSEYNLRDAMKLFRETLGELESPILLSNFFEFYLNNDSQFARNTQYSKLREILNSFTAISIIIENADEFIAMITLHTLIADRVCVYDSISYFRYIACKVELVDWLEQVYEKTFLHAKNQLIIDLLNMTCVDIDIALNTYLISERTILANVVTSLLKNEEEHKEAKETIRYIDSLIGGSFTKFVG